MNGEDGINRCAQCMYGEKDFNEMPCCECTDHSLFVNCRPYDESVSKMYDGWFEEVCGVCQQIRNVHNDPNTDLGNPGFICLRCQEEQNKLDNRQTQ